MKNLSGLLLRIRASRWLGAVVGAGLPLVLAVGGLPASLWAQSSAPLTTLYTFMAGGDGNFPATRLLQDANGDFYGTTSGNTDFGGTVFRFSADGVFTTLHRFTGPDGQSPGDALTFGRDGNLYGTAMEGGAKDHGTVFRITRDGVLTTLYSFAGGNEGDRPAAPLVQDGEGNFYGTSFLGGAADAGTVFKLTPGGELTTLHAFTGGDGRSPRPGLIRDDAGNLYSATALGGAANQGTVFRLDNDGVLTTFYSFDGGSNGGVPFAGLTRGDDGNFYGVTTRAARASGTVFRVTPNGSFSTLHRFTGTDGADGQAPLVQGRDGNFYGTTVLGGANAQGGQYGTLFRLTPDGTLTTLYSFFGGADGQSPQAALTQGIDGNFYGVTSQGAANGNGTIFKLFLSPTITAPAQLSAALGQPFTYVVKATNAPASYAATGLPAGLSLDSATGRISGTPTQLGTFTVNLSATNPGGTATAALALTITDALPVVTLAVTTPAVTVGSGGTGIFTLSLSGPLSEDLFVNFTIKGSAVNGTDYVLLKATKKIKAGKTSKPIKIIPQGNLGGAAKKAVKLLLVPGDGYVVGTTEPVKVKILSGN